MNRKAIRGIAILVVLILLASIPAYWLGHRRGKQYATRDPLPEPQLPFRHDAEFMPHAGLLLNAGELVTHHQEIFVSMLKGMQGAAPLFCLFSHDHQLAAAYELMRRHAIPEVQVYFVRMAMNTMWLRDFGPHFVRLPGGSVVVVDTDYTNINPEQERWQDNDVPGVIASLLGLESLYMPIRVEGGNIVHNGDGLYVTTTQIFWRNETKKHTAHRIRAMLEKHLGLTDWLVVHELPDEPTGHVDMFITFLARHMVLVAEADPETDPVLASLLDEAAAFLQQYETVMGPMNVHRLPLPPRQEGHWRTYNNCVMLNGRVLVPVFSDVDEALQRRALQVYETLLPGWQVVPVPSDSLIEARGFLRCVTGHIPNYVDVRPLISLAERPGDPENPPGDR